MNKIILVCCFFVGIYIGCAQNSRALTHKEKADIQYQLSLMAEKATSKAVEIKYESYGDGIEDIRLKESYKNVYKQFEGVTAPSDNVILVEFIRYGTKINNMVEVTVSFETGGGWSYDITSKYDFNTHKFERADDIFMYMCAQKGEYEGMENDTWLWNVQLKNAYNKVKKGDAK
ncbi:MAG: hypothetical protein LBG80_07080 [Bacteroidales bacterium]|jgi:hypothetical protein|nr:hypothetical protein [Bacteroidales bacterium]